MTHIYRWQLYDIRFLSLFEHKWNAVHTEVIGKIALALEWEDMEDFGQDLSKS